MQLPIPEPDWKRWRRLAPVLLERFCQSVLEEAAAFAGRSGSAHENYLALFDRLQAADRVIQAVFDAPRRSTEIPGMAAAIARGLMSTEELAEFSADTVPSWSR